MALVGFDYMTRISDHISKVELLIVNISTGHCNILGNPGQGHRMPIKSYVFIYSLIHLHKNHRVAMKLVLFPFN